jgi:predicted component of type VI protein secretion system
MDPAGLEGSPVQFDSSPPLAKRPIVRPSVPNLGCSSLRQAMLLSNPIALGHLGN